MAKDDEIFKKLSKEKPLVRQKDLKPLSSRDFAPKRSPFDLVVEKPKKVGRAFAKPANPKSASRGVKLADKYNSARKKTQDPSAELEIPQDTVLSGGSAAVFQKVPEKNAGRPRISGSAAARDNLDMFEMPKNKQEIYIPDEGTVHRDMPQGDEFEAPAQSEEKLSYRHELKYYINYKEYILLRNTLRMLIPKDPYTDDNAEYFIRSLYFDDAEESALEEKMEGTETRNKYRIRIYNLRDNVIKFEKKMKRGQFIAKKDLNLSRAEYESVFAGEYGFLLDRPEPFASDLYLEMTTGLMRPKVIVDYMREAYVSPIENVRITFDKDLRAGLTVSDIFSPDVPTMPMFDEGTMVLEVKFNKYLPPYIEGVVNNVDAADRSAISKYVICRKYE